MKQSNEHILALISPDLSIEKGHHKQLDFGRYLTGELFFSGKKLLSLTLLGDSSRPQITFEGDGEDTMARFLHSIEITQAMIKDGWVAPNTIEAHFEHQIRAIFEVLYDTAVLDEMTR